MRFELLEAIYFELDRLLQKPRIMTGFEVQSRGKVFEQKVRSPVILEDLPSNTLTRSLLGFVSEVWEFVWHVAWPADSILVEVDTTKIQPFAYSSRLFVMQIVFFTK
jgi:hypothetical protein